MSAWFILAGALLFWAGYMRGVRAAQEERTKNAALGKVFDKNR
jgi:protein-S-isoprenylcysteine O-methyltransferase Ste14